MSGRGRFYPPLAVRFWQKVDKSPGHGPDGDCWMWTGAKTRAGYGQIGRGGGRGQRVDFAHRVSFEIHHGIEELPRFDGRNNVVCHRCDNPTCVNPDHLFLGTTKANAQDCVRKGRKYTVDQRGEANYQAKLTEDIVRAIRADARTYAAIGEDFEIAISHVCNIKRGVAWPHLV